MRERVTEFRVKGGGEGRQRRVTKKKGKEFREKRK